MAVVRTKMAWCAVHRRVSLAKEDMAAVMVATTEDTIIEDMEIVEDMDGVDMMGVDIKADGGKCAPV